MLYFSNEVSLLTTYKAHEIKENIKAHILAEKLLQLVASTHELAFNLLLPLHISCMCSPHIYIRHDLKRMQDACQGSSIMVIITQLLGCVLSK